MKTYYKKVYPSGDVEAIADYFNSLGINLGFSFWNRYACSWSTPSDLDASGRVLCLSHQLSRLYRGGGLFDVRIYNDSSNHLVVECFPSRVLFCCLFFAFFGAFFLFYILPFPFPFYLLFPLIPFFFISVFILLAYKMHYKSFEKDLSGVIKEEPIQLVSKWKLRP